MLIRGRRGEKTRLMILLLLLICGDVESNPGPRCEDCSKPEGQISKADLVLCNTCHDIRFPQKEPRRNRVPHTEQTKEKGKEKPREKNINKMEISDEKSIVNNYQINIRNKRQDSAQQKNKFEGKQPYQFEEIPLQSLPQFILAAHKLLFHELGNSSAYFVDWTDLENPQTETFDEIRIAIDKIDKESKTEWVTIFIHIPTSSITIIGPGFKEFSSDILPKLNSKITIINLTHQENDKELEPTDTRKNRNTKENQDHIWHAIQNLQAEFANLKHLIQPIAPNNHINLNNRILEENDRLIAENKQLKEENKKLTRALNEKNQDKQQKHTSFIPNSSKPSYSDMIHHAQNPSSLAPSPSLFPHNTFLQTKPIQNHHPSSQVFIPPTHPTIYQPHHVLPPSLQNKSSQRVPERTRHTYPAQYPNNFQHQTTPQNHPPHPKNPDPHVYSPNPPPNTNQNKQNQINSDPSNNPEKKSIYVIGDSMIKNLQGYKMSKRNKIEVKSISGANSDDLKDYIKPTLKKKPDAIIIHIGTNDIQNNNIDTLANIKEITAHIHKHSQTTKVSISSIIHREDKAYLNQKIDYLNNELFELCKGNGLCFIDNQNITLAELNGSMLHLNRQGTITLAKNIIQHVQQM